MTSSTMHSPPPLSEFPTFKKGLFAYYETAYASIKRENSLEYRLMIYVGATKQTSK